MLQVTDLACAYGDVKELKGISLEVKQGEIVTLVGANGAGKSTTLRAISGLLAPAAGWAARSRAASSRCSPSAAG